MKTQEEGTWPLVKATCSAVSHHDYFHLCSCGPRQKPGKNKTQNTSNLKESVEALEWQDCLDKYLWVCFPFPQTSPLLSTVSQGEIDPAWYVTGLCWFREKPREGTLESHCIGSVYQVDGKPHWPELRVSYSGTFCVIALPWSFLPSVTFIWIPIVPGSARDPQSLRPRHHPHGTCKEGDVFAPWNCCVFSCGLRRFSSWTWVSRDFQFPIPLFCCPLYSWTCPSRPCSLMPPCSSNLEGNLFCSSKCRLVPCTHYV